MIELGYPVIPSVTELLAEAMINIRLQAAVPTFTQPKDAIKMTEDMVALNSVA